MHRILGVPDPTDFHPGIDTMGSGCRIDHTVSVMRRGRIVEEGQTEDLFRDPQHEYVLTEK